MLQSEVGDSEDSLFLLLDWFRKNKGEWIMQTQSAKSKSCLEGVETR
jgi:hypothetical protein